ncbi:MAG: aminotransferase class I/II-fold pyridoxal phosphate-dependent enzyme [Endomicrobia bacterium]|nr:aminotransferase class I/II-fold pyridoxal phosphate-dependent enzyme [Endomicrobiia bacterium]
MINDIFAKCYKFTDARQAQMLGIYPYFKPISTAQTSEVIINGQRKIVCCSNNYLGLTVHPKVKQAVIKAVKKYGTSCTGSRFLSGSLDLHEEVEEKFARFINKESTILFTTGHHVNLGVISSLVGKGEVVITDKLDHASIIDGCMIAEYFGAEMVRFRHNNLEDLERVLRKYEDKPKLIVVDGVFSMEGDICNLPGIIKLAKLYGARVMVDDAHALGVLGQHGRGTAEHFGLEAETDLIMVTASKSLASIGGFIAGREEVIHYIKHHARSLIFTAALPPAQVAAISAALDVIQEEPERRKRLWDITNRMLKSFKELGFDTKNSQTPIIPIVVGGGLQNVFSFWRALFDEGVFTSPVLPPAVPEGEELIRTSYMAIHTDYQLEFIIDKFAKVGRKFGLIPGTGIPKGKLVKLKKRSLPRRIARRFLMGTQKWMKRLFLVKK